MTKKGIYIIRCKSTNKVYVGSSSNIEKRWIQHRSSLRAGTHHSHKLQKAWNEYGDGDFILEIAEEVVDGFLSTLEQSYIDSFNSYQEGYNVSPLAYRTEGRPAAWNETKQPHKLRLTPACWKNLQDVADANDLPSKVEAIEHLSRYAVKNNVIFKGNTADRVRLIEAVLDAVEDVLHDGVSTEECLPPHPSYEVSGDAFRRLGDAFAALMEAEGRGNE